jgi:hypothetical protein
MEELIEIYELKLKNIIDRLEEFKELDNGSYNDIKTKERFTTKKFEYMAFLDDLKRICPPKEREIPIYITKKVFYCLFKKISDSTHLNYYYVRISSTEDHKVIWSIGFINEQKYVTLIGGDLDEELSDTLENEYFEYKSKFD